jgi:hypothetical protein
MRVSARGRRVRIRHGKEQAKPATRRPGHVNDPAEAAERARLR